MKRFIQTVIGVGLSLAILAVVAAAVYRSYGPGSMSERLERLERRWSVFTGEGAGVIWGFIGKGVVVTLQIAVISIVLSLIFGVVLALMRMARHQHVGLAAPGFVQPLVTTPATVLVQSIRASPLFMLILYVFIATPKIGLNMSGLTAGIVALTLYTSCVLAEIVRAGILSLDKGQFEAAAALGLGYYRRLRRVILPQALRRMVPAVVSQLVTLIKDTSLLSAVTVLEVFKRLSALSQQNYNPIETTVVAAAIYFAMNFSLSLVAQRIERGRRRVGGASEANLQGIGSEDQTLVVTAKAKA